jgi:hypothetical protein
MGDWEDSHRAGEGRWSAFGHTETSLVCGVGFRVKTKSKIEDLREI